MGAFFSSSFIPEDKQFIALATCCLLSAGTMLWNIQKIPPLIYDKLILQMTEVWYKSVLSRVKEGNKVLDIGIGTAGMS